MEWGNSIVMKGILYEDIEGNNIIVPLLKKSINNTEPSLLSINKEEWDELLMQFDKKFTEGTLGAQEKMVLQKGTRQIDSAISWNVFRRDNYACRYCGINFVPLTVDHIITWETGGATHEDNLLTSCRKCNRKRGNTPYEEWITSSYYLKKADKYLSNKIIKANELIVSKLDKLPRVTYIKSR